VSRLGMLIRKQKVKIKRLEKKLRNKEIRE
jgi:hypothetical protein